MAKSPKTYEEMRTELDHIMLELQSEDIGIDQVLQRYERGLKLIKEIEAYLKTAENKIHELKTAFETEP